MDGTASRSDLTPEHTDDVLEEVERDRRFNCARLPASETARLYVHEVLGEISRLECRRRGRKAADLERHVAGVTALSLDLIHREMTKERGWIAVSLDKAEYTPKTRKAPFLTESFVQLVRLMHTSGLIELRKGEQGAFGTGRRTTVRAGKWLLDRMEACEVFLGDISIDPALSGDNLVLRAAKVRGRSRDLKVPETEPMARRRAEMTLINSWLADAEITWAWHEEDFKVDLGDRFLRRIFNGSPDLGGRLYGGFWQGLKNVARLDSILFGDDRAVSLDFGQMAVRSAYSEVGVPPPDGDLYEVPGLERYRYGVKRVLNALLAAPQLPQRFPAGSRGDIPKHVSFNFVLDAIKSKHAPIVPLFGTGVSLRLMYLESEVLVAILLRLRELGTVALPIHDCLLVGESNRTIAKETMETVFKGMLGSTPTIDETMGSGTYTPYAGGLSTPTVAPDRPHKKGG